MRYVLIAIPTFVAYFEATMIVASIPTVARELSVSPSTANLLILVYVLVEVLFFVPMAFLVERIGLRTSFLIGGTVLGVGGLLIPLTMQVDGILILRAIQGVGASLILPSTLAYASLLDKDAERGKAVGFIATAVGLGYGLGLPIGGLLAVLGWKYLFVLSSLVVLCVVPLAGALPQVRQKSRLEREVIGPTILLSGVMLSFVDFWIGLGLASAGLVLALVVRFAGSFTKGSLAGFLHSMSRSAATIFLVLFYTSRGFSPIEAGLLSFIFPLSFVIAAFVSGSFSDHFGLGKLSFVMFTLTAIASLLFLPGFLWMVIFSSVILGAASGIATTANTAWTMNHLPPHQRVVGAALRTMQGATSLATGLELGSLAFPGVLGVVALISLPNVLAALVSGSYR